jgi:hypothetical protein
MLSSCLPNAEAILPPQCPPSSTRAPTAQSTKVGVSLAQRDRRQRPSDCNGMASVTCLHIPGLKPPPQNLTLSLTGQTQPSITVSGPSQMSIIGPGRKARAAASSTPDSETPHRPISSIKAQRQHPAKTPRDPPPLRCFLQCPSHDSAAAAEVLTVVARRVVQIGIETEFHIAAVHLDNERVILDDFVWNLAENHNKKVHKRHCRMQNQIRRYNFRGKYEKWCLVEDPSIAKSKSQPCECSIATDIK